MDYTELAPWYDMVENLIGLPAPGHEPAQEDAAMRDLHDRLERQWPALGTAIGRTSPPLAALALAKLTGRVSCRHGAVVHEVLTDANGATAGISWFDRPEAKMRRVRTRLVFLAASALETGRILMMSRTARHPEGLGGQSGALGRNLMDHLLVSGAATAGAIGASRAGRDAFNWSVMRRMDCRDPARRDETAPYSMQVCLWAPAPRHARFAAISFAPMAPRPENGISLHPHRRDAFGRPVLRITCRPSADERATVARQARAIAELAEVCGAKMLRVAGATPFPGAPIPGSAVHEAGVARMGLSPHNAVLNPFNECWDAPGLFVTDAAAYPALPYHSPTLTGMALTARAVDNALRARGHAGLGSSLRARSPATAAG